MSGLAPLILIIIIIAVPFVLMRALRTAKRRLFGDELATGGSEIGEYMPLLNARWAAIREEIAEHGQPISVPRWWSDQPTPAQLARLEKDGIKLDLDGQPTKGQCSDIISMTTDADDDDLEILTFFGQMPEDDNQLVVREQIRHIFTDPKNRERWENQ